MKAPNFRYARPSSLDEAFRLLETHGDGAVPLAGGQTLLATLAMRLSAPELLVDLGDLTELAGIAVDGDDVVIGALTRHSDVLESPLVRERLPLVAEAVRHVGHVAIRNRGTLGGSLAYADPAAELPACAVALGARLVLGSPRGSRVVAAEDFFTGLQQTALQTGELILQARVPAQPRNRAYAFAELSRRQGDFAIAGVAALASLAERRITAARLVYFGCADYAKAAQHVAAAVIGRSLPLAAADDLADALARDLDPTDSPGTRAATKLQLAAVLTRRVLNRMADAVAP
jgi:carbon-monoxide dehydrogenase medium subunit